VSFPCCKLLIKYVLDVTMTVYGVAYIRECHSLVGIAYIREYHSLVEVAYIRECHSLVEVACIRECHSLVEVAYIRECHSLVDSSQGFLEHGELQLIACHRPTAECIQSPLTV
jgi:hypothetical protein